MSQLYARVFVKILDSSIAEDFTMRHVFEDFLKLADFKTGVVDVTRQALSRKLNIPLDLLNQEIAKLEAPDPASRDPEHEGRRLERLDPHRDWGWRILNWGKYDDIKTKADVAARVARHREAKKKTQPIPETPKEPRFKKPTIDEVKLHAAVVGLSDAEAGKFFNYYESNGWRVGKNPMKSVRHAMTNWKTRNETNQSISERRVDRNIGTANEGKHREYEGLGRVAKT